MSIACNVAVLIILMVQIETIQMTTNSTGKDQICESLRDNNGNKLNLLTVGKTPERLLLITKDLFVYDVAADSMDSALDKLYLRSKPMPLEKKYPTFYSHPQFKQAKDVIFNAWVISDVEGDWICITVRASTGRDGVNYNIKLDEVALGWKYFENPEEVLLSTQQPCKFYSVRHNDGGLKIQIYGCSGNSIRKKNAIGPLEHVFFKICFDQSKTKIMIDRSCGSGTPVQWPVLNGFVSGEKFYLFSDRSIYVFPESAYNQRGQPVEFKQRNFYWIIGAIILLLLILMIILWCILVAQRRRQQAQPSYAKTGRSGMRGGLNVSKMSANIATARSRNSLTQAPKLNRFSSKNISCKNISHASQTALSAGSAHLTARTGLNRVSNTFQNRLKRLTTRIQSSRH
ncbi:hypothetical protein DERP_004763 [Dermatophagoides pteronyssinus]|uniref:Uncharacterized protein n=1 Tax=Dermatophagoides pteronyssinus TaxID=6956 RepID=A0ABQ8JQ91_DERPT|nr:hypothetical protein DERP_004763 [Dermatophagoides pteronyssinus]